jgi:GTP-binding protein
MTDSSLKISSVEFCFGVPKSRDIPDSELAEVAMVGRSNVGKSTLLNRLTLRKDIAKVSSRPGKTLEFNYFKVAVSEPSLETFWLVDLPGFGYAKQSLQRRKELNREIAKFLVERSSLKIVCLLNDIRRNPEEDELNIRELCIERGVGFLVVLTKVDKLNQKEKMQRMKELCTSYNLEKDDFILTGNNIAVENWWSRVKLLMDNLVF